MVNSKILRQKLSKQLMIDLEAHEKIHLRGEPLISEVTERDVNNIMEELGDRDTPCNIEIRQLGEFIARISLGGGYSIPVRFEVLKR
jgi:hypothetical protein